MSANPISSSSVACRFCGAEPGAWCRDPRGAPRHPPHKSRRADARLARDYTAERTASGDWCIERKADGTLVGIITGWPGDTPIRAIEVALSKFGNPEGSHD